MQFFSLKKYRDFFNELIKIDQKESKPILKTTQTSNKKNYLEPDATRIIGLYG